MEITNKTFNVEPSIFAERTLQTTGSLHITSVPIGESIYIDNILQSGITTPATIADLPAGSHTYRLTLAGYQDVTNSFSITSGQETIILVINRDSQILDGTQTYNYINIVNGGILYVTAYDGTGTTGRLILNSNEINIDNTSSINGSQRGYRGGAGGPVNTGGFGGEISGNGGGENGGNTGGGAGGGGYGIPGGNGGSCQFGSGGTGGITKGTINGIDIDMGSGGGGAGGGNAGGFPGQAGGAMLTINANDILIRGNLNFDGGVGGEGGGYNSCGGGGASGGGILLNGTNIDIRNATITTNGGIGGGGSVSGHPGGGGRVKVFCNGTYKNFGANISSGTVLQPTYPVIFNSFPSGATIIIDGTEMVPKTNAQFDLGIGIHDYILRLTCYEDIAGQINVVVGPPITISGSFIKNTGDLSITSQPSGANVYFGPNLVGQTPLSYTCYPETTQDYYISLLGYQPFIGSVDIIRNLLSEVNTTLIPVGPPGVGSIYVVSTPPGASIFLDGTDKGQITPDAIVNIPIGPHAIRLEKTGYSPATSPIITVGDNQTSSITMNLTVANTICSWIESKGGWTNIAVFDIMTLVSAYLGQTNIGFTVTISHIMGAIAYYLNNVPSGNSLTGCTFV